MDYEEKYKEALEWARGIYPNAVGADKEDLEHYFPELAESEDERKDIKRAISVALDYSFFDKETADNCLAWLEKQGKQEPTLRERYENISTSEWLKRTYDGMSCGMEEEQSQVKESSILQHEDTHEDVSCKENDNSLTREYDERIRKAIRGYIDHGQHYGISNDEMIAWLEKKSEEKSWSEEDEQGYKDVDWCINRALRTCFNENETGTCWFAQRWVNSIKVRLGGVK